MGNTKLKERLMSAKGTTTTLAVTESNTNFVALESNALEIIRENLKNQPLSMSLFDIVKSPSGGSTVFCVPGLSGDEAAKELTGIILDYSTPRAYWNTPDPVEGHVSATTALSPTTARLALLVLLTITAQGTETHQPKPARSLWFSICLERIVLCRLW